MSCEECSRNCQLLHRKKKDLSSSVVRFLKILIGNDEIFEFLPLPPKFAKTISHLLGKETKVEDSTGAHWTVTLSNHDSFLAFNKGWSKFAADHMLQEGDILVFNYLKKGHFVVHVYDASCTERTDFGKRICPVKRARTTEKIVSKATLSRANTINDVNFDNVWQSNKKARASGVKARNILEMGAGDVATVDTSAANQVSSSTSTPVMPNFEDHLNQHETSSVPQEPEVGNKEQPCLDDARCGIMIPGACYAELPLKPDIGNKEQPCLDDACCVIMDRGACYAETEKLSVLCDLSVFEIRKHEYISSTRYTLGDEDIDTHAQTNVASRAEANRDEYIHKVEDIHTHAQTNMASRAEANLFEGNNPGSACNAFASKVDQTGMVQYKKGFGQVDMMHVECKKVLPDKYGSSHRTSVKLAEMCRTADSISKGPWQNAIQSKEISSNCHDSQVCNEYASALPKQVNSEDANHTIIAVKKEQVQLRRGASDHAKKSKGADPKQSSMKEAVPSIKSRLRFKQEVVEMDHAPMSKGPDLKQSAKKEVGKSSKSEFKQETKEMDPEYANHVSASVSASISYLVGTDDRDFIKLPSCLQSVTFRKARGKEDNKCGVLLLDPQRRCWPAIYYEKFGLSILICGWKRFKEANNIGPGDGYVFSLEDESQCLYKVDVVPESRDSEGRVPMRVQG